MKTSKLGLYPLFAERPPGELDMQERESLDTIETMVLIFCIMTIFILGQMVVFQAKVEMLRLQAHQKAKEARLNEQ
jgi:hypothetical protein